MPKSHARYAPEYRRRMVELVRAGRSPDDLAKEFEPIPDISLLSEDGFS
jgi:transposase